MRFSIRFWSKLDNWLQIRSELNTRIEEGFKKEGIAFAIPQRDVHLKVKGEASGKEQSESKSKEELPRETVPAD